MTGEFRHRVEQGDVLVLDPRRIHGYEQTVGLNIVNILLDPGLFPQWNRAFSALSGFQRLFVLAGDQWDRNGYQSRVQLDGEDCDLMSDWIQHMEDETHSASPEAPALAENWAFQIVGLLSRRAGQVFAREAGSACKSPSGINRLFSWIELHLEEPIQVEDLAREAGMSVRTLQRSFRQRAGVAPMQYLVSRRMACAERLLKHEPEVRIAEIGRRCGYEDPQHFSKAVRKAFGRSPRELRGE